MIDAGVDEDLVRPVRRPAAASGTPAIEGILAALDVIDDGQHEPAVEQLERLLQVLRNSGAAEPSCPKSFNALAEHMSTSPGAGRRPVDLERRPAHGLATVQLRAAASHATHLAEVTTPACSNVIIARRGEARADLAPALHDHHAKSARELVGSPCE
jgi:hypothetical protein